MPSLLSSRPSVVHTLPLDEEPDYESWEIARVEAALDRVARSDETPDRWRDLFLAGSPSASIPPQRVA